ncbi:hypothetical protein ACFLU9_02770, partial [Chloroflexota bacterium]
PDLPAVAPLHHTLDTPVLANALSMSYDMTGYVPDPIHVALFDDQGDAVHGFVINPPFNGEWLEFLPQDYMIGSYDISNVSAAPGPAMIEFSLYLPLNNLFIQATVDINPNTLNLKSKGNWITAYIELPEGYDVADIDIGTVLLDDTVPAETALTNIGDYDADGIGDLMVKFDRQEVIDELEWDWGTTYSDEITITLNLDDGTTAEGSDTIKILAKEDKGKGKK